MIADSFIPVRPSLGGSHSKQSAPLPKEDPDVATILRQKKTKDINNLEHAKTKEERDANNATGAGVNWVMITLIVAIIILVIVIIYFVFKYNNGASYIPANILNSASLLNSGQASEMPHREVSAPVEPVKKPKDFKEPSLDDLNNALNELSFADDADVNIEVEDIESQDDDFLTEDLHTHQDEDNTYSISIDEFSSDEETDEFLKYQEDVKNEL